MPWERELDAALRAARRAGEIALRHRELGVSVETKPDDSPVTAADRECERFLAAALTEAFPEDGLLGEEGARAASRSGRRWIIDPIDGTRDYVRGNRLWAVLIGLETEAGVVAGVAHFPALGETYSAARGTGAFRDGSSIRVSPVDRLSRAVLCLNGFNTLSRTTFAGRLIPWMEQFWAVRSLGGAPDAMLVASGRAEVWIEHSAKPWDLAPIQILTEEAGGCFFNFDGGRTIHGGNCVTCAPALEAELRRFVAPGAAG